MDPLVRVPARGCWSPSASSSHTVPGCVVGGSRTTWRRPRPHTPPTSLPTDRTLAVTATAENPAHSRASDQVTHLKERSCTPSSSAPSGHAPRRRHHAVRRDGRERDRDNGRRRTAVRQPSPHRRVGSGRHRRQRGIGHRRQHRRRATAPAPVTAPRHPRRPHGRGAHHERGRRHRVRQPGDRERRCSGHRHGQCRVGRR